jgi:hypothetical protein
MELGGMVAPFTDEPITNPSILDPGPQIHETEYRFESIPASQNFDLPAPTVMEQVRAFKGKLANLTGKPSMGS